MNFRYKLSQKTKILGAETEKKLETVRTINAKKLRVVLGDS